MRESSVSPMSWRLSGLGALRGIQTTFPTPHCDPSHPACQRPSMRSTRRRWKTSRSCQRPTLYIKCVRLISQKFISPRYVTKTKFILLKEHNLCRDLMCMSYVCYSSVFSQNAQFAFIYESNYALQGLTKPRRGNSN